MPYIMTVSSLAECSRCILLKECESEIDDMFAGFYYN